MKITEINKEYLEKGGLIRRKCWDSTMSIGLVCANFIYYKNLKPQTPVLYFSCMIQDILADDWELVEEPNKKWQPEDGKTYYLILTHGSVDYTTYVSTSIFDNKRLSFGNLFKTKEEAQHMAEKLKIINKLRELSNIDFNSSDNNAYVISYDRELKKIQIDFHDAYNELPFNIHFATKEDCQKAIDIIGEENLKKYYFDVVNDEKKN